jgi:hypothetical protein
VLVTLPETVVPSWHQALRLSVTLSAIVKPVPKRSLIITCAAAAQLLTPPSPSPLPPAPSGPFEAVFVFQFSKNIDV